MRAWLRDSIQLAILLRVLHSIRRAHSCTRAVPARPRRVQEAVDAWDGYSPAQQDAVFEAAVLSQEDWAGLEENLHYALLQQQ